MRRWLATFLLVFLPLQLTWAAVSTYCEHENGFAAQHVGHHEHEHMVIDDQPEPADPVKSAGADPDCAACHAGCVSVLAEVVAIAVPGDSSYGIEGSRSHLSHPPSDRLERPQWPSLA